MAVVHEWCKKECTTLAEATRGPLLGQNLALVILRAKLRQGRLVRPLLVRTEFLCRPKAKATAHAMCRSVCSEEHM
jgi:hypothetical protein